jgi:hypothetical protein
VSSYVAWRHDLPPPSASSLTGHEATFTRFENAVSNDRSRGAAEVSQMSRMWRRNLISGHSNIRDAEHLVVAISFAMPSGFYQRHLPKA